jgi:isocitrate/isopropylmalate dehydrogenase
MLVPRLYSDATDSASARGYDVVAIRGDGIGPELLDAALHVLKSASEEFGFRIAFTFVEAGAARFVRDGIPIASEEIARIGTADAMIKGPVGLPDVRHFDGTEAGVLGGQLRIGLDLYANIRPILLLPGITSKLRADPGSIDYVIVRENTEGLYASRGKGVGNDWAVVDTLFVSRHGTERIARAAFDVALERSGAPRDGISRVTCVDKANVLRSLHFFREVFLEVAEEYPSVEAECLYVDAAAQALVLEPERFDVLVTENLFGDILSDLGGATVGGIAQCPSANLGADSAYFEPIHGSAPAIAGKAIANPIGQILAGAMMLDYLGEPEAGNAVRRAVRDCLESHDVRVTESGGAAGGAESVALAVGARLRSNGHELGGSLRSRE